MNDKDVEGIAAALFPRAAQIVLSRPHLPRAMAPREIARRAGASARKAQQEPSVYRALALARRLARAHGPDTPVVVAGTLFLVGEVKGLLEKTRSPSAG
jgi:folylpolyglutamate synthase/dihydropteroate synthase